MRSFLLLGLKLGFSDAPSVVVLVSPESSEGSVCLVGLVLVGEFDELISRVRSSTWEHLSGDLGLGMNSIELVSGGVVNNTLLRLVFNPWEENQLGFISVQSLHVDLQLLITGAGSSVVNSNSNGSAEAGAQVGSLELL